MSLRAQLESGRDVSVVMITLNEEGAIAKVVNDIRGTLPEAEIVVVDSSKDRTAEIARSLNCVVVRQFPPEGYGRAMDKALTTASKPIVCTLDCDDTYPVAALKDMLLLMQQGADLVSASRLQKRPAAMPFANYLANRLFAWLAFVICNVQSTDVHTGMRAYSKELIKDFPYDPDGPALPVELQVGPAACGWRCEEMFIDYRPRVGESKLDKIRSTIWTVKRLWRWRTACNSERKKVTEEHAAALRV
ncbi:MAG TPA: glycosyltransferase family 2 protein [Candidatus Obscuribacterales bacterium]